MSSSGRFTVSIPLLRRLALASVVANVGIVVTGGAVRLTGSGLGCPTWPRCTDESYRATPEMGIHGAIEFGNRLLTFALGLIVVAVLVAALLERPRRRGVIRLAVAVCLGIPAQAVVGGVTVLTNLNPWVVGLHFLASIAVIGVAYVLWRRVDEPAPVVADPARPSTGPGTLRPPVPGPIRTLAWLVTVVSAAVLVVGTWVTGSGPHAGDEGARRNGLDPESISQVHADLVFLLLGLVIALYLALRALAAPAATVRATVILLLVILGQGLIGFVQYFTHLPALAVGAHMLGACLVWLATLAALWSTRAVPVSPAGGPDRAPLPAAAGDPATPGPGDAAPGAAGDPASVGAGQRSHAAIASASRSAAPSA